MAQPPQYTQQTDFSQDEANNVAGRSSVRTPQLDAELTNLATSINALVTNIGLLQRDDGALKDNIVTQASLSSTVNALFVAIGANPRGAWLTATAYAAKDIIETGAPLTPYMCVTAHTSGVFATDYAAGKWVALGGATPNASQITSSTTGDVAATNVQSAIAELASEKMAKAVYLTGIIWSMGVPLNFSIPAPTVAGNAMTIAVKGADGADASATNIIYALFRSATPGSGAIVLRSLQAALSLTISSGSTLGHNSGLKQYTYVYLIDNGGAIELAVSSKYFGKHGIVSTTAEGGAGAADSGTVMYSTTARANVAFMCVGMLEDTQVAAGTWTVQPSMVHLAPFELPLISFSAHKNGANQVGIANGVDTKVTFGTEVFDNGSLFASDQWVPPPGSVELKCAIKMVTFTDGNTVVVQIFKNGALYKSAFDRASSANTTAAYINMDDECNGTDFYEVWVNQSAGAAEDINGGASVTWFQGKWTPQRS